MKRSFIISVVLVALVAGFNACDKEKKSSENRIASFVVNNMSFDVNHERNEITQTFTKIFMLEWTGSAVPVIILMDSKADYSPKDQFVEFRAVAGTTEVANYTVTAEDGSERTYRVLVTVTSDW